MDKKNKFFKALNMLYYAYKRNNWMFDFSRFWNDFKGIKIDRPIFFLGTHGGGLTLISRILRRNKRIVSVSGNYKYWSGADEMQSVLAPILPFEFSGIKYNIPKSRFKNHTSWLYATHELINSYRMTEEDVTSELRKIFRKKLRWMINRHAIDKTKARFTDKSQTYTIRLSFINEILKDCNPKFILVTRNPYAACYRAPKKARGMKKIRKDFSYIELIELAAQHWSNSMKYALRDKDKVDNFLTVRFEDVLQKPEKTIRAICEFGEIDFNKEMLPKPEDEICFGSKFYKKWYPLRPEVNEKYLEEIKKTHVEIIDQYCHKYAEKFGYEKPINK